MTLRCFLTVIALLLPTLVSAEPIDEPCWGDPDTPCILIGLDPQEVFDGDVEESFFPPIDHYFRVVDVFPITMFEMGVEYIDCFIKVETVLIPDDITIDTDGRNQLYVEDFDDVFKPMNEIVIDFETCSSPLRVPEEERNLP